MRRSDYIAHLDGFTEIDGGFLNRHWIQLAFQLADSVSGFAYSFGGSCLILFIMNLVPGLGLRASEEAEVIGMDDAEIGEFAVGSPHSWFAVFLRISSTTMSSSPETFLMETLLKKMRQNILRIVGRLLSLTKRHSLRPTTSPKHVHDAPTLKRTLCLRSLHFRRLSLACKF